MHEGYSRDHFSEGPAEENLYDAWMHSPWHTPPGAADGQPLEDPNLHLLGHWDPSEELVHLLEADGGRLTGAATYGESVPAQGAADPVDPVCDPVSDAVPTAARGALHQRHRRVRTRNWLVSSLKTVSFLIAALTAVIVAMVSVFGGIVAYDPLRAVAASHAPPSSVLRWWPLLVYGPWLVASLCILRAALLRRRAVHSWAVVLFFSAVAVALCVSHAPKSVIDASAAALPTIAALSCFQQLVRLITLTRPPRQSVPRHRQSSGPAGVGRLLGDSDQTRKTSPVAEQPAAQAFLGGAQSRIPQQHSTAPGVSGRRRP